MESIVTVIFFVFLFICFYMKEKSTKSINLKRFVRQLKQHQQPHQQQCCVVFTDIQNIFVVGMCCHGIKQIRMSSGCCNPTLCYKFYINANDSFIRIYFHDLFFANSVFFWFFSHQKSYQILVAMLKKFNFFSSINSTFFLVFTKKKWFKWNKNNCNG